MIENEELKALEMLEEVMEVEVSDVAEVVGKTSSGKGIAIGITLLIGVGIGGYVWLKKRKNKKEALTADLDDFDDDFEDDESEYGKIKNLHEE